MLYAIVSNGLFSTFLFPMSRGLACCTNLQPGGPGDFGQGFLPLALDTPVSNCKAAVLVLVRPGHFIFPEPAISGEHSPIRHQGRRAMED